MREMGQSAWLSTSYPPYRALREESMRGRQEPAVTTGYHGAIIILSGHAPQRMGAAPRRIAPSQDHTSADQCVRLSYLRNNYFAGEDFEGLTVWPNKVTLLQDAQKVRPARPQAIRNRRRTLRGTLRISMSRERRWRAFSASCR